MSSYFCEYCVKKARKGLKNIGACYIIYLFNFMGGLPPTS